MCHDARNGLTTAGAALSRILKTLEDHEIEKILPYLDQISESMLRVENAICMSLLVWGGLSEDNYKSGDESDHQQVAKVCKQRTNYPT